MILRWNGNSKKKSASSPKSPEPSVLPDWFQTAVADVFERAAADEYRHRKIQRYWLVGLFLLAAALAGIMIYRVEDLTARLQAPDYVLREQRAQRRIIMGPAEVLWREPPQPGDQVIPPATR